MINSQLAAPDDGQVPGPLTLLRAWSQMAERAYAPNTLRAWRADWEKFNSFCMVRSRVPMPACAETVRDFVFACVGQRKKPATIRRYVATIAQAHRAAGAFDPTMRS